ncbi:hypothetical protein C8F04DRAFT_1203139 [Mycena alexandri]|uniref:Uncharacterized protein n=1 Tax=Mycena alexandri TaxID=1745969 RepID=A0AAD6RVQ7_9AGAR|nr:hypothetical protein C8F04DRAFT_1203139 [Mycena alexandri]
MYSDACGMDSDWFSVAGHWDGMDTSRSEKPSPSRTTDVAVGGRVYELVWNTSTGSKMEVNVNPEAPLAGAMISESLSQLRSTRGKLGEKEEGEAKKCCTDCWNGPSPSRTTDVAVECRVYESIWNTGSKMKVNPGDSRSDDVSEIDARKIGCKMRRVKQKNLIQTVGMDQARVERARLQVLGRVYETIWNTGSKMKVNPGDSRSDDVSEIDARKIGCKMRRTVGMDPARVERAALQVFRQLAEESMNEFVWNRKMERDRPQENWVMKEEGGAKMLYRLSEWTKPESNGRRLQVFRQVRVQLRTTSRWVKEEGEAKNVVPTVGMDQARVERATFAGI